MNETWPFFCRCKQVDCVVCWVGWRHVRCVLRFDLISRNQSIEFYFGQHAAFVDQTWMAKYINTGNTLFKTHKNMVRRKLSQRGIFVISVPKTSRWTEQMLTVPHFGQINSLHIKCRIGIRVIKIRISAEMNITYACHITIGFTCCLTRQLCGCRNVLWGYRHPPFTSCGLFSP